MKSVFYLRVVKYALWIILGLVFVLNIGSLISLVLFSRFKEETIPSENNDEAKKYPFHSYNTETGGYSSGFATIYRPLSSEEYIFYESEDDNELFLISTFDTDEYVCTGSCVCVEYEDETNSRRLTSSHSTTVSKTLTFLVAALSSVIAFDSAKTYFSESCIEQLEMECPSEHVYSEVEECHPLHPHLSFSSSSEQEEVDEEERKKIKENIRFIERNLMYECTGSCISDHMTMPDGFEEELDYECPNFSYTETFYFNTFGDFLDLYELNTELEGIIGTNDHTISFALREYAKFHFITNQLQTFCGDQNVVLTRKGYKKKKNKVLNYLSSIFRRNKKDDEGMVSSGNYCKGYSTESTFVGLLKEKKEKITSAESLHVLTENGAIGDLNPSVECKDMMLSMGRDF